MNKIKLATITLIGVTAVVLFFSYFSTNYLYEITKEELWSAKLEASERESREIALLLEQQLKSGIEKPQVIKNLQASIQNTDFKSDFICMYNREDVEICHPNPSVIGSRIEESRLDIVTQGKVSKSFRTILSQGLQSSGVRTSLDEKVEKTEIISVYPVKGTDWMVAYHANIKVLEQQFEALYLQFHLALISSTVIISLCAFFLVRFIYKKFESKIRLDNDILNKKVSELLLLNELLNKNQQKFTNDTISANKDKNDNSKKRIVSYHKDELIMLEVSEIAYIFLDNSITYIVAFSGNQLISATSLDEIMKDLKSNHFFRANRQFIINIKAIKNILIYSKNQLLLKLISSHEIEVVISKNKVSEFKQWIDQ